MGRAGVIVALGGALAETGSGFTADLTEGQQAARMTVAFFEKLAVH